MWHFLNVKAFVLVFFTCSVVFSLIGGFVALSDYPPYLDFDAATEATFINSYVHYGHYDYYFDTATLKYNPINFGAQRLPFTLTISPIVKFFHIKTFYMPEFFKILASMFAILGCVCASTLIVKKSNAIKGSNRDFFASAFVVAFSVCTPSLFIFMRGGIAFNLMAFFLFWLVISLFVHYCRTDKTWPLYAMSFAVAYFALNKYPPLAGLPPALFCVLVFYEKIFSSAKNIHCYLALILCLGVYVSTDRIIGEFVVKDYDTYLKRCAKQTQDRQFVFSFKRQFLHTKFSDKVEKLVNQHVLFKLDDLGDTSREDDVYTLGVIHYPFLFMLPLLILGAVKGEKSLKNSTNNKCSHTKNIAHLFLLIALSFISVFLTISFPEGRYITPLIPCYAYFIWCGLTWLCSCKAVLHCVAALLLFVNAGTTYWLITTNYNNHMHKVWKDKEGLKELAMSLPPKTDETKEIISMPWTKKHKIWHYFALVTGLRAEWLSYEEFKERFRSWQKSKDENTRNNDKIVFYFMDSSQDSKLAKELLEKGFKVIKHFPTKFKKEPRVLLQYAVDGNTN